MANARHTWKRDRIDSSGTFNAEFNVEPVSTALLIIDMQKYGCRKDIGMGKFWLEKNPAMGRYWFRRLNDVVIPNIQRLLDFFRKNRFRVIHICVGPFLPDASDMIARRRIRDENGKSLMGIDHFFHKGRPEYEIIDELKPVDGEMIIDKNSSGAFNSSNIDQILRNTGMDSLVITGVATNACVETTARDASDRGYKCILVDDACATIQGQKFHDMTMTNFALLFGQVMLTSGVIKTLRG